MFDGKYLEWNQRRIKAIIDFYGHKFMFMKKVLDLGSGQGDIGGALHRLGADVTLVDARQEHLTMANKKFQGLKTVKADLDREWPFQNKKFDLILDLGLLCHLKDFKAHLKQICASCQNLVLETAVSDFNEDKCVTVEENKAIYDNSINGIGCRPSAEAIENVLTECGFSFKRMDSDRLNASPFVYDWPVNNSGDTSLNKRRMWFCLKTNGAVVQFSPSQHVTHHMMDSAAVRFHHVPRQTAIARPPGAFESTGTGALPNYPIVVPSDNDEVRAASQRFAITPERQPEKFPNLKVLYLPLGRQPSMEDGFKNLGVQLEVFDFYNYWQNHGKNVNLVNQTFLDKVRQFQPQFIHMQLQMTGIITSDSIRQARKISPGVIITNWSGDIRQHVINEMKAVSTAVDYTLISSTGQLQMYQNQGCPNMRYWQVGFDPKSNYPLNYNTFKYDVSFIGNHYGHFPDSSIRLNAVNKCRTIFGARFGLFGAGWGLGSPSCEPRQGNEIYNQSVCALSISNFNNVSHYFSDRFLYCVASGRPTISWYYPGIESYFEDQKEIFYARSVEDIINIVNWCKNNLDKAAEVGRAGAARALAEHTFTSKTLELLHIVGLAK